METLTVLYDAHCRLCRQVRRWLESQPAYVSLRFVAAGSWEARERFPLLNHQATLREVTVIGDAGEVYTGAKAWVMCLWALRGYRHMAQRLASPSLLPTAGRFVEWVSRNRSRLGRSDEQDACDCDVCQVADAPDRR